MSACCVSGCKNRHSSTSKLKFYRIPSGYRPFQANRRRLWLQAIEQVNGSTEGLKGNARICGAHFISGEASMDHDSPDFVPSVFKQSPSPKKKVKWFYGRRKRRRRTANAETKEETAPPQVDSPVDLQSYDLIVETQTPSSLAVQKEEETLTKEEETEPETKRIKLQTTSSPNKASPRFKAPEGIQKLDKKIPIVLLKTVLAPAGGYQCELCNEKFTITSLLVKHKQLHEKERSLLCDLCGKLFTRQSDLSEHQCVHESRQADLSEHQSVHEPRQADLSEHQGVQELRQADLSEHQEIHEPRQADLTEHQGVHEPRQADLSEHQILHEPRQADLSEHQGVHEPRQADLSEHQGVHEPLFPCNICDRSFTTSHNLKRHKLLHVRDARKCPKCGVLFCKRHKHVVYLPQTESVTEFEEDSSVIESQTLGGNLMLENSLLEKSAPSQPDLDGDAQSTMTITPLLKSTLQTVLPAHPKPGPLPKTCKAPLPASHTRIPSKIPAAVLIKPSSVPIPSHSRNPGTLFQSNQPMPDYPTTFDPPQHPELPPSLKMFSPQFLTSALLEVERNYEYILSKTGNVKKKMKPKPCEPMPSSPDVRSERTAHEMEIVL